MVTLLLFGTNDNEIQRLLQQKEGCSVIYTLAQW